MKKNSAIPLQPPQEGQPRAIDLSASGNALRFCTLVLSGVFASSLLIGALGGSLESFMIALTIAGGFCLIAWLSILVLVVVLSIPQIACWFFRRVTRRSPAKLGSGKDLADEWLDGPI